MAALASAAVERWCFCGKFDADFVAGAGKVGEAGKCEAPHLLVYSCCGVSKSIRCKSALSSRCKHCARIYKAEVRTVCSRGIERASAPGGTLTLTAPGAGRHCRRHRRCLGDGPQCEVCPCSRDHFDVGEWNATLGKRWNRLLQAIRRGEASVKRGGRLVVQDVQYFRALETQHRGALHLHVPMVSGTDEPLNISPRKLRALAMKHGFGHSLKWDPMTGGKHEASKLGGYVAKYVSKTVGERPAVPWRAPGEHPHKGRLFRTWVASRRWRCRMLDVRTAGVPRRHDVEAVGSKATGEPLAEGEPLDSLWSGYTLDRAPPPLTTCQLAFFDGGR